MFEIRITIPGLEVLADAAKRYVDFLTVPRIKGAEIVYIVKDDQQPVNFQINPGTVTDAKGNAADASSLDYLLSSSDETVATVAADPSDKTKGTLTFTGKEGAVTVNVSVEEKGTVIGSFAANFTVTAGDPAAISGGSIVFDGLVEAPDATTTPAPAPSPAPEASAV